MSPDWFVSLASETGPVITAIIVSYWHLNRRLNKLEIDMNHQLNNGLRADLTNLRIEVANIEGRCGNCPSNKGKDR